ncbi:DUF4937 domain-containing protein [Shewanella violacea]|uniref:DUF4937 domain-containing protein n=1 Tax=Shewanella violacea (strain JCM 10179 / CIP 106290 / LMG 19151 / DSS12) TaxID=637905 RepID=D4ZEB5_SHEVD|nr:DUF4937 domain-containing protein [Shewanella violacea]BAJ04176.1 conserved hypothetical protein [Shewanella violacea DSS12]
MIAKYIRCDVTSQMRPEFSKGQGLWQETAPCDGFISQLGGWERTTGKAIILALWRDMNSIQAFMTLEHDVIAENTNQAGTYSAISVSYLQAVMTIPGSIERSEDRQADCGFMRIADCQVSPTKADLFIQEQQDLWNPGMQKLEGFLGGHLWQFIHEPQRYLVTSYWLSEEDHDDYVRDHFPLLKQQAASKIIATISGHQVQTEKSWKITL